MMFICDITILADDITISVSDITTDICDVTVSVGDITSMKHYLLIALRSHQKQGLACAAIVSFPSHVTFHPTAPSLTA